MTEHWSRGERMFEQLKSFSVAKIIQDAKAYAIFPTIKQKFVRHDVEISKNALLEFLHF